MKHKKLILSVLSFSIFSSIFTMERLPLSKKQLSINCDDILILDRIDQEINKKYPSTNALVDFFKQFTEKDMLSIIKIPHQWCNENDSDVTPSSLNALYKKNSFFEKAVNYFTEYARENFDNVTTDTIAFVADPDINQS